MCYLSHYSVVVALGAVLPPARARLVAAVRALHATAGGVARPAGVHWFPSGVQVRWPAAEARRVGEKHHGHAGVSIRYNAEAEQEEDADLKRAPFP